jgi:phospholipase A1
MKLCTVQPMEITEGELAKRYLGLFLLMACMTLLTIPCCWAGSSQEISDECLLNNIKTAAEGMTVGELRSLCGTETPPDAAADLDVRDIPPTISAIELRFLSERKTRENSFVITPHKPNYVLPVAYNIPNREPYLSTAGDDINNFEVKFQVSFKFLLSQNLLKTKGELYAAYTNQSYWQAYSSHISSPFRETNHEPEIFLTLPTDWQLFGFHNKVLALGAVHQSNGRSDPLSRSWNRIYAAFIFEKENVYFMVRPWWRIPESSGTDDNPDILDYMGYGELRAFYKSNRHMFGLLLRNNFDFSENRGALQLDWSFPLMKDERLKGYVQYFFGYGESLIDYNSSTNRIGVGLLLTDWL